MKDVYKWKYISYGSQIVCIDSNGVEQVQAMCKDDMTAKVFADILNSNRKPHQVLHV